jgi:hypothetical protein
MSTTGQRARPRPDGPGGPPRARGSHRVVRRQVTVRRVDPWTVLKLSLIFYFCLLLVVMVALFVFWGIIQRLGVIQQGLDFLAELNLEVTINEGNIARALFLIGVLNVVLWSGINVFLAFLYNLVADLLGGLRMTLAEEERPAAVPTGPPGR